MRQHYVALITLDDENGVLTVKVISQQSPGKKLSFETTWPFTKEIPAHSDEDHGPQIKRYDDIEHMICKALTSLLDLSDQEERHS
jgi:hypothetical protein